MSVPTPPENLPSITDPSTFAVRAQETTIWMKAFAEYLETLGDLTQLNVATSLTSFEVGSGSRSITVEINKSFAIGMPIRVTDVSDVDNYLVGTVTAYNGDTGALSFDVDAFYGTGTHAAWSIIQIISRDEIAALETSINVTTQTIYIPASALLPTITNGATAVYSEATTNKNILSGLAFDAATQEHAQFSIVMPKSWNRGTVTAKFDWTHGATTTNFGVTWALQAVAVGNDDALDVSFGTEQIIADVGGTTDDLYITASTPALTIAGTPAEGDRVNFQVFRDVADAGDTMAVDAVLLGVTLLYGTVSNSDA